MIDGAKKPAKGRAMLTAIGLWAQGAGRAGGGPAVAASGGRPPCPPPNPAAGMYLTIMLPTNAATSAPAAT